MEQPFYQGQDVISLSNFREVRKIWGYNYPYKGDIVKVLAIRPHPIHNFWLVIVTGCECELCHERFAPLQEGFEAITFERVMEEEKVSVN